MGGTEDARVLAGIAAAPQLSTPDGTEAFLDGVPIAELASMWCALTRVSRRKQAGSVWAAILYFDRLPHKMPHRALDLALEVLRSETDKPTVMQLNSKLLPALIYAHGADVVGRLETEARNNEGLRWVLGGTYFYTDEPFKSRIGAIADIDGWSADEAARAASEQPLDCAAMSVPELARAWVEQYSKSDRDRDDNFFAIMDYERDLRNEDPGRLIDLVLEVLKIETNPVLLSILAAGPLEDVISMETIDRIEQEAAANERFHDLLGGVWYSRASDDLRARLDALIGDHRW